MFLLQPKENCLVGFVRRADMNKDLQALAKQSKVPTQ